MERVPLSDQFTLTSIVGFLLFFTFTAFDKMDKTWGITMILIFGIGIIASFVSIYPEDIKKKK